MLGALVFGGAALFAWLLDRQKRALLATRREQQADAAHAAALRDESARRAAAESQSARLPELENTLYDLRFETATSKPRRRTRRHPRRRA